MPTESVAGNKPLHSQTVKRQDVTTPFCFRINLSSESKKGGQHQLSSAVVNNEPVLELPGKGDHYQKIKADPKYPSKKSPSSENVERNNQPTGSEGNESKESPSEKCEIKRTVQHRRRFPKIEPSQKRKIENQRQKGKGKHAEIVPDYAENKQRGIRH